MVGRYKGRRVMSARQWLNDESRIRFAKEYLKDELKIGLFDSCEFDELCERVDGITRRNPELIRKMKQAYRNNKHRSKMQTLVVNIEKATFVKLKKILQYERCSTPQLFTDLIREKLEIIELEKSAGLTPKFRRDFSNLIKQKDIEIAQQASEIESLKKLNASLHAELEGINSAGDGV